MKKITPQKIKKFQNDILSLYKKEGRHSLPFRQTNNPYQITVAEIMLQQTQVDRVIPFYETWIKKWPTWKALANATNKELFAAWSGLGYNRRALFLRNTAEIISNKYNNQCPKDVNLLLQLPGIGPYTAHAILIFAYNKNIATVDTNIRRVLIHELNLPKTISISGVWKIAHTVLPKGKSRTWHNALMDYASLQLPKTPTIQPLTKQSKFIGSLREIRGGIIKELSIKKRTSFGFISKKLNREVIDVKKAAASLQRDGMIILSNSFMRLS